MIRSKRVHASQIPTMDIDSSQASTDDSAVLSPENNSTNIITVLPSSITNTPRQSVKGKRSLVWRYFKPTNDTSFDAECILCSSTVVRSSTATSNLLHHIQARHDNEYQIVNKTMKLKTNGTVQRLPLSSDRSFQLTKLAADLIISNLHRMDKTNIRFYIFTKFKLGVNAKQIHKELCDAWGEGCVSYTTVAEWIQRFNQGRTSIEDHPRFGRAVTAATDRNIEVIRALIDENPHISIMYMVFETGLSYGTINRIIHDDLKLKKLCARWICHKIAS